MERNFTDVNDVLDQNIGTSLGANFSVAWNDFTRNALLLILFAIVYFVVSFFINIIPFASIIFSTFLGQFFVLGNSAFIFNERSNKGVNFEDFFKPFQKISTILVTVLIIGLIYLIIFTPMFLAGLYDFIDKEVIVEKMKYRQNRDVLELFPTKLIITMLITLPFYFYASIVLMFAPYFAYFYNVTPIEAIKLSFKMGNKHFLHIFLLLLFVMAINFVGIILCCVGLIASIPLSYILTYHTFSQITELEINNGPQFDFEKDENFSNSSI